DMMQEKTIAGVAFQVVPIPGEQFAAWAAIDDHFAVAIGDAAAQQIVAGLRGQHEGLRGVPAVAQLLASCKVERPMLRTYASLEKIAAQVPFAHMFWSPLGLSNVSAALAESG